MLYLSASLSGFLLGAVTTLFIRFWNTHQKKKYGFQEIPAEKYGASFYFDADSQYAEVVQSVDGSCAIREFKE